MEQVIVEPVIVEPVIVEPVIMDPLTTHPYLIALHYDDQLGGAIRSFVQLVQEYHALSIGTEDR